MSKWALLEPENDKYVIVFVKEDDCWNLASANNEFIKNAAVYFTTANNDRSWPRFYLQPKQFYLEPQNTTYHNEGNFLHSWLCLALLQNCDEIEVRKVLIVKSFFSKVTSIL